jgi:hypothetical protein
LEAAAGFGEIAIGERDPEEMGPFLFSFALAFLSEWRGKLAGKMESCG